MGLLNSILKSKSVESAVEKVLQFGEKTLTVMKPEVSEWAMYNGGITVPKSMMSYYEKAGMSPISTFSKSIQEVFVRNGAQNERLVIRKCTPLTGLKFPETRGKQVIHQIYKGNEVKYLSELSDTGYGKTFRSQVF